VPAEDGDIADARAARLLALADRAGGPESSLLIRNFLGHILCSRCGARTAIQSIF
jgi:hypothetical protein